MSLFSWLRGKFLRTEKKAASPGSEESSTYAADDASTNFIPFDASSPTFPTDHTNHDVSSSPHVPDVTYGGHDVGAIGGGDFSSGGGGDF